MLRARDVHVLHARPTTARRREDFGRIRVSISAPLCIRQNIPAHNQNCAVQKQGGTMALSLDCHVAGIRKRSSRRVVELTGVSFVAPGRDPVSHQHGLIAEHCGRVQSPQLIHHTSQLELLCGRVIKLRASQIPGAALASGHQDKIIGEECRGMTFSRRRQGSHGAESVGYRVEQFG